MVLKLQMKIARDSVVDGCLKSQAARVYLSSFLFFS